MIASSPKDPDAPYWAALAEGRLEMPKCGGCGIWHWPAVSRCGECGHWGLEWSEVPMEGTIFAWTRTHHPFGGTEHLELPYVTVVVALSGAGERRLIGLLDGVDKDAPVVIGTRVTGQVGSTRYGDENVPTIKWRVAEEAGA